MLGRFELFLALRNQVADRVLQRRALALEAVMEELAAALGRDAVLWGLCGLGADIDVELCVANPARRGLMAEELLLTEGVPADAAAAARRFRAEPVTELPPLAQGLVLADALVTVVAELEAGERSERAVAHALRRREKRGDPRAAQALAALALDADRAAELALAAHLKAGL